MQMFNRSYRVLSSALGILLLLLALPLVAQESQTALTTRASLQEQLARLERDPRSQGSASLIRARLDSGDFRAGDRIVIRVDSEPQLSDTFTVAEDLSLVLPQVGTLPLKGVLRSELQDHVTQYLSQYVRNPVVQVRPLMRVLVEGYVAKPGYYGVAPEQPISDVLSVAGGLMQGAKVNDMRIERGQTKIIAGQPLRDAMGRGYSLDRLNIQAGDRVFIPGRGDSERTMRLLGLVLALPLTVLALTKAF